MYSLCLRTTSSLLVVSICVFVSMSGSLGTCRKFSAKEWKSAASSVLRGFKPDNTVWGTPSLASGRDRMARELNAYAPLLDEQAAIGGSALVYGSSEDHRPHPSRVISPRCRRRWRAQIAYARLAFDEPVAQLDRASAYEAEGWRFDPSRARHSKAYISHWITRARSPRSPNPAQFQNAYRKENVALLPLKFWSGIGASPNGLVFPS